MKYCHKIVPIVQVLQLYFSTKKRYTQYRTIVLVQTVGDTMKQFLEKLLLKVPDEYTDAFNERISQENYQRFTTFGSFFLFHEIFTYFSLRNIMASNYIIALRFIIIIHAMMLLFFFYGRFFNQKLKPIIYNTFFIPALIMILGWTVWFTLTIQSTSDRITPYVLGIYMIAVVAYLKPLTNLFIFNSCFAAFIYFLPRFQADPKVLYPHYLNGFFLNMVAIMTSILFYRYLVKDFLNKKVIEKQNAHLLKQSKQDTMTGLFNHQYSYERLEEEIDRATRYGLPLSILLLDLDKFKDVNDHYGHQFGDKVLESFAALMTSTLRHTDIIGRYGGEEFIIIMTNTGIDVAERSVQRLQTATYNFDFGNDLKVTFSGGLVNYTDESAHELIEKADKLLYHAKANGRDKVLS